MNIDISEKFYDRMKEIIINDGDFFSVGKGIYYFNMLLSLKKLYNSDDEVINSFLLKCFQKILIMLPSMMNINPDRSQECIKICKMLYTLVSGGLFKNEYETLFETFKTMSQASNPEPSLYGAVLGLLYGNDVAYKTEISKALNGYLSGSTEMHRQGASFIRGLFYTARDIVLVGNEKSAKLKEKINKALNITSTVEAQGDEAFSPMLFVESIHKGGKARKIQWLYEAPNSTVHFRNGNAADDKYMQAILLCYADMSDLGVNENAKILAQELNGQELGRYAETIFSKWTAQGADAKKKWVLYFCAIHGGNNMIEVLLNYIKEWAENTRGAIASEAVRAIACNGSSEALMSVDNIAHKFKHKQVKSAAVKALDDAAEELGITSDELGDRIVPDLDFDENMERIFDYGTRKFKVYLTPTLELEVFDESNKKLKTLPSPAKKDDETIAKQSNSEFKAMKKQLKNVVSIQKLRLETALLADRRWIVENWNNLFVKNPVMHSFSIGLICAAYENDNLVQTFRYMEDGTFNTADEDEFELPENCTIGLVHPIDFSEDELSTWKEQLSDYEITQPIEQLERKVYRIKEDEIGQLDFNRFKGRTVNGMTLLGRMAKSGWYKGSVQDAGCFYTFYREDITKRFKDKDNQLHLVANAVELNFSGMYVGGDDEEVTIENIRFYKPGTVKRGSYEYDEPDEQRTITPDKINPRYLSEIINQIETILK